MKKQENFIFVDLAGNFEGETGKAFDGFIPGKFTDMWGSQVVIDSADLDEFMKNTLDALEYTKTESGELVGLPIDAFGHDRGDGAGWIVGVELGENAFGKLLRFIPKWTEVGLELLEKGVRRFFSPTVDMDQMVIMGGSLTNWPASRKKTGQIMLRPIELSQGYYGYTPEEPGDSTNEVIDMEKLDELSKQVTDLAAVVAGLAAKPVTEPAPTADLVAMLEGQNLSGEIVDGFKQALLAQYEQMRQRVTQEAADMIAGQRREASVTELAARVTGGTVDVPRGLPVKSADLKTFMLSLDPAQLAQATAIFDTIWRGGLVEFSELGSNHPDNQRKIELPAELRTALDAGEMELADLKSPVIAEWIGSTDQYDLSPWTTK